MDLAMQQKMLYSHCTSLKLGSSTYCFLLFSFMVFTKCHVLTLRVGTDYLGGCTSASGVFQFTGLSVYFQNRLLQEQTVAIFHMFAKCDCIMAYHFMFLFSHSTLLPSRSSLMRQDEQVSSVSSTFSRRKKARASNRDRKL